MNSQLDKQNEMHSLATITPEELPGYTDWISEWESQQEQDWAKECE